jgi:hypothetical protein
MKVMELLHRAMCAVEYRHIDMPIKWSAKWTTFAFLFCLLLPWRPLGRYRASSCPMAAFSDFMKALDLLHRAMNAVLHRRTTMAIEMACKGGAFVCCRRLFCLT